MNYRTMINIDEDGWVIGLVEIDLLDENGKDNPLFNSPYIVPKYDSETWYYSPRWDFEKKEWYEGKPDELLKLAKNNLKMRLKSECKEFTENNFSFDGDRYFFDKDAQLDFAMQLTYITAGLVDDEIFHWKTLDNDVKIFNKEQFFNVCKAANKHYRDNKAALWKLEIFIDTLSSMDELNSITDFENAKQLVKNTEQKGGE